MNPSTTLSSCPVCGTSITIGARFCMNCGSSLDTRAGTSNPGPLSRPTAPVAGDEVFELLREATLGEYDIYGELGRGGMASVYLALDMALDRQVAIKVMSPALLYDDAMRERFRREAKTAAALSHPHIIPIYAVRETDKILYFVMKYVDGRSLDSIVRELRHLPIRMVQAIVSQVGGALAYAHRRKVFHRDIKPANIMIDVDGWAVVTDFGIAKVQAAKGLTTSGAMIGTPHYMSPEQFTGTEIGPASDQYALGVVAYEMLVGRTPFVGETVMEVMKGHLFDPPPAVGPLRPNCPAPVAEAVMRMLAKEPENRWPTLDEAVGAVGSTPLAHDDPIHMQMVTLAKSGMRPRISVPMSPIPAGRASTAAPARPTRADAPPPEGRLAMDGKVPVPAATRVAKPAAARRTPRPSGARVIILASAAVVLAAILVQQQRAVITEWFGMGARTDVVQAGAPAMVRTDTLTRLSQVVVPDSTAGAVAPVDSAPAPRVEERPPAPVHNTERRRSTAQRTTAARDRQTSAASPAGTTRQQDPPVTSGEVSAPSTSGSAQAAAATPSDTPRATAPRPAPVQATVKKPTVEPQLPPLPTTGTIRIGSGTPNAELFVNGESRGSVGPLATYTVPVGTVRLTIRAAGCTSWEETVTIIPGAPRMPIGRKTLTCE